MRAIMKPHNLPSPQELSKEQRVDVLFKVLERAQDEIYIGEPISQLAHALQAAALGKKQGADSEIILGALFHDLGHLIAPDAPKMDALGVLDHENIAANVLHDYGFGAKVSDIVRGHVKAKRYLCWKKPEYYKRLSEASKGTLQWQGGPMSDKEALEFEASPLLKPILQVRSWDEQAKVKNLDVPVLETYREMALQNIKEPSEQLRVQYQVSKEDLAHFSEHAYLHIPNPFNEEDLSRLRAWAGDLMERPETPGKWMKYFEETQDGERVLCRVENFLAYHGGLSKLITDPVIMKILEQLMGEPACLFKEKMNVKLPGGAGFGAHQDAPAFVSFGQKYHITMMISIDDSTEEKGCLEFSEAVNGQETLKQGPGGVVHPDIEKELPWRHYETRAGDIVFFDSYIPHRSSSNRSKLPRRALYITYNKESEGDRRDDYYVDKRLKFPPDCERKPGVDYDGQNSIYNLGNPIK